MTALIFEQSRQGYANLWAAAQIRPERRQATLDVARRVSAGQARYARAALGRMPWWWVGAVHNLEASCNFRTHLHNGDPLTARTVHVPAGRPAAGSPPFSWEDSARDALIMRKLGAVEDWSTPRCLYEFEAYNGFGYVSKAINSPYVWSFTNQYKNGKYVADGKFDGSAVSQQCGAAATLKALVELNLAQLLVSIAAPEQAKALDLDRHVPPITTSPAKIPTPQWDIVGIVIGLIRRLLGW